MPFFKHFNRQLRYALMDKYRMLRFSNLANSSESLFEQLDFFHNRKNISNFTGVGSFHQETQNLLKILRLVHKDI